MHRAALLALLLVGCAAPAAPPPVPPAPACPPSPLCGIAVEVASWNAGWLARHLLSAQDRKTIADVATLVADSCPSAPRSSLAR